jgi:hypothetical protein
MTTKHRPAFATLALILIGTLAVTRSGVASVAPGTGNGPMKSLADTKVPNGPMKSLVMLADTKVSNGPMKSLAI